MKDAKKLRTGIVLLLCCLLVTTLLAACGGDTPASQPQDDASAPAQTGADDGAAGGGEVDISTLKIAMLVDAPINDGSWNSACYSAMTTVAEKYGMEHAYTDNVAQADFAATYRNYCNQGFNIIFATGSQYTETAIEVSADYPDCYFILLNSDVYGDNYISLSPSLSEQGFMSGSMASLQTQTKKVGFVGGKNIPTTAVKLENYRKACALLDPEIEVFDAMAGTFTDTVKGKEIAAAMVANQDVDVIYGDASAVDSGIRLELANYEDRWQIGQPANITHEFPDVILTCVVTDNVRLLELAIEEIKAGTFGGKVIYGTLENGVLAPGDFGTSVSEETQEKYLQIIESIKAGTFETDFADGLEAHQWD